MPVTIDWFDHDNTIMIQRYITPWDWQMYDDTSLVVSQILEQANQPVNIIVDFSQGDILPSRAITHLRKSPIIAHSKRGVVVMIGTNPYFRALGDVLARMYPRAAANNYVTDTIEEALQIIKYQQHALLSV